MAVNIKKLAGVPALAKSTQEKLKTTLEDIMQSIDKLKKLGDGLDKIGAECSKEKKLTHMIAISLRSLQFQHQQVKS